MTAVFRKTWRWCISKEVRNLGTVFLIVFLTQYSLRADGGKGLAYIDRNKGPIIFAFILVWLFIFMWSVYRKSKANP